MVTNGALDFRMAEQKLDRTQISSSAVDQSRFGPPQGVSAELQRVWTNAGDPCADQPRVLPYRETAP